MRENMKKTMTLLLAVVLFVSMTGCSSKEGSTDKAVEPLKEFTNTEYNKETDSQNFFHENADIVKIDDGYIIAYSKYINFVSDDGKKVVPLCSNVDCLHNSEECDAYANCWSLRYYNGSLYYVEDDDSGWVDYYYYSEHSEDEQFMPDMVLYKKSLDGSVVEKINTLCTINVFPIITVHRGYAYYNVYLDDNNSALYRIELKKNAKPEMVYQSEGLYVEFYNIKGYGDGVMFAESYYSDEEVTSMQINLMYYDSKKNAVFSVKEDIDGSYALINEDIYYIMPDGLYCYDLENRTDRLVIELEKGSEVFYDGKYIYLRELTDLPIESYVEEMPNGKYILHESDDDIVGTEIDKETYDRLTDQYATVIDLEGNVIDVINTGKYMFCAGDEKFMFTCTENGIAVFDKLQIGTQSHEWSEIEFKRSTDYIELY